MSNFKKLCKMKPQFVIVRDTGNGYSLDNTVNYNGPFAKHVLSQKSGYNHPSLDIESNWGLKKNYISRLKTGKFTLTAKEADALYKAGKVEFHKNNNGYYIASKKTNGAGASISELSIILKEISNLTGNIPYRGSPIEYKRILDYLQFLAVKKVDEDERLFFARPNNETLMKNIRSSNKIQNVFSNISDTDIILYRTAYFMSFDRLAAFASVVRNAPTIYDKAKAKMDNITFPRTFVKINKNKDILYNVQKIRQSISEDLGAEIGIKINNSSNSNKIISYGEFPIITKNNLFGWFLNVKNWNDRLPNVDLRIKVLFYWIFFYPNANGSNTLPNMKIIEYFLSIADTFHDFGKKSKKFENIVGTKEEKQNAVKKTANGIAKTNIPNTSNQLKFIVKLLGADIYRAVDRYNKNVVNTLSTTNTRKENRNGNPLTPGLKVAHFLYLIANIFGSSGSNISQTEEYAGYLMYRLGTGGRFTEINVGDLCDKLNIEKACIVVDAVGGRLNPCLKKLSIYHNVGILDTAPSKGILSLGKLVNSNNCIKTLKMMNNNSNNMNINNRPLPAGKKRRAITSPPAPSAPPPSPGDELKNPNNDRP
jgi:hypothetical protein